MRELYLEQVHKLSVVWDRIIVTDMVINTVCIALFRGQITALLLSDCKFQAFIINFLSEHKSMSLAEVTSEHALHKPVAEQDSSELHLFLIKEW